MFRAIIILLMLSCTTSQKRKTPHSNTSTSSTPRPKPAPTTPHQEEIGVSEQGNYIKWLDSDRLMPVLEMAQRERKPVFIEFYASWCAPCKVMEEEIFSQEQVYRYLNTSFLNFRTDFDSESGKTIAAIYEVKTLPTVLFINPQGVVLERHTGIVNPSLMRRLGDAALEKMQ
jgi:thiol:disulfide interchange protein